MSSKAASKSLPIGCNEGTVQLVDGASGGNLWAERYGDGIHEVFAVQDEVTELIVGTLGDIDGGRLQKAWQGRANGSGTRNMLALDHFSPRFGFI